MAKQDARYFFPELDDFEDRELARGCEDIWNEALAHCGWNEELFRKCPIDMDNPQGAGNTLDHIHDVIRISLAVYDYLKAKYPEKISCDRDTIRACALLHDVGKLYEYAVTETAVCYSPSARLMRHPLRGAIMIKARNLPDAIAHAVATHSFEGDHSAQSVESYILKACDRMAYNCLNLS